MKIMINGQTREIAAPLKVNAALKEEGYEGKAVAVAVNGHFIPKAQYPVTNLMDGDEMEVVSAMQGG